MTSVSSLVRARTAQSHWSRRLWRLKRVCILLVACSRVTKFERQITGYGFNGIDTHNILCAAGVGGVAGDRSRGTFWSGSSGSVGADSLDTSSTDDSLPGTVDSNTGARISGGDRHDHDAAGTSSEDEDTQAPTTAKENERMRVTPMLEDVIAGALVGVVTGAVAGGGSGAALGGAGGNGIAGTARGAAVGASLGSLSGAAAGAMMASGNPDVAAAGLGAAGIGAAAGVGAVLATSRVPVPRSQVYDTIRDGPSVRVQGKWPPAAEELHSLPSADIGEAGRPHLPDTAGHVARPATRYPQAELTGDAVVAVPSQVVSAAGPKSLEPAPAPELEPSVGDGKRRSSFRRASMRRASEIASAEIEMQSAQVIARFLDGIGNLLVRFQKLQAASEAAITQATLETVQKARNVTVQDRHRREEHDAR